MEEKMGFFIFIKNVVRYFKKNRKEESNWNTRLLLASNPKTPKEILVALMYS